MTALGGADDNLRLEQSKNRVLSSTSHDRTKQLRKRQKRTMSDEQEIGMSFRRFPAPQGAAIAGIAFSALFTTSVVLTRLSIPSDLTGGTDWVTTSQRNLSIAFTLMPFAGIAFLWFVGVIRDRLGSLEDQFISTVFFGSALLFLAMVFVSIAVAGGILATVSVSQPESLPRDIIIFGRAVMLEISNVYALRMASVFMLSLSSIWWRTRSMPSWLPLATVITALTLLLVTTRSLWFTLLFPVWVLLVSVYILARNTQSA